MQEFVFFIEGDVNHPLTIDPTVWIFDERKIDLDTYFDEAHLKDDEQTAYTKAISAQWDKEIIEGSEPPRPDSNGNKIKYEKQKLTTGSYAMPLKPFLQNAEPQGGTTQVEVVKRDGSIEHFSFEQIESSFVAFSSKGQPLREDGPVHLYLGVGPNRDKPIKNIKRFILKK